MAATKRTRHRINLRTRTRFEVLSRHGFRCFYCGSPASEGQLEVDHVIPVSLGGVNEPWNLVPSCWACNNGKAATPPTAELVERAKDAYLASDDLELSECQVCGRPMRRTPNDLHDGDGFCPPCFSAVFSAYQAGARYGGPR